MPECLEWVWLIARDGRGPRLVVYIRPNIVSQEVWEKIVSPSHVASKKILESAQTTMTGHSKKKLSFGPLEESFTHSDKFISCITKDNLLDLRVKYHIPNI